MNNPIEAADSHIEEKALKISNSKITKYVTKQNNYEYLLLKNFKLRILS